MISDHSPQTANHELDGPDVDLATVIAALAKVSEKIDRVIAILHDITELGEI